MLGISSEHVLDRPDSEAHRLAARGECEVRFSRVGGDEVVEVIRAGERYVLRGSDGWSWGKVVRREALDELAEHLGGADHWRAACEGDVPAWLRGAGLRTE